MKQTLTFSVSIQRPPREVWQVMFSDPGYRQWTTPFCEGSYFTGTWEQGAKMHFLAPGGDGMVGIVEENRPFERLSIRHVGELSGGAEDTSSDRVKAWAPAYETYTFVDTGGSTELTASVETLPEHRQFMSEAFPKALAALKALCEGGD